MISLDMKYTSLYWALRYVETSLDVHEKNYKGYDIKIFAEQQRVDYGMDIIVNNEASGCLLRHKDFVVLECVDRLLNKGYSPSSITLLGDSSGPDIVVGDIAIYCVAWGSEFKDSLALFKCSDKYKYSLLYTSRLVSGLLEYKNILAVKSEIYNYGVMEPEIELFQVEPSISKDVFIEQVQDIDDFVIHEDELILYRGSSPIVKVPNGVVTIGASAFWNNTVVELITLPETLERLGGDCFYYCVNLNQINIPKSVSVMGNNPFAGCPKLQLNNYSESFILEQGVLFNRDKSNLIHYSGNKLNKEYVIPDGVTCLGKHCFYGCEMLRKLTIPESVLKFENNPFSGCVNLSVINKSRSYIFELGIIYNRFKTTIVACLNNTVIEEYIIPETVTLISRNAFWNCKGIKNILITKNVKVIGYNPFAGCENLTLKSSNDGFNIVDGIMYNKDMTEILCATNKAVGKKYKLLDSVKVVCRAAFSGCIDLKDINFNSAIYLDKSSFTNCKSLENIYFTDKIEYVGEWAFAYCTKLAKVSINAKTVIDKNAFNECPVIMEMR